MSLPPSPISVSRKRECGLCHVAIFSLVGREVPLCLPCFNALHVGLGVEKAAVGHFQFAGGVDVCKFKAPSVAPHEQKLHVWLNLPTSPPLHLIPGVQLPSPQLQLRAFGGFLPLSGVTAVALHARGVPRPWGCVEPSPSPWQPPACRRRTRGSGGQTAPRAAAEEGCSAKPRRSKTGKVDNKTTRLRWGFRQKVAIKLPSPCGRCHRFPREIAGRGRVPLR